MSTQATKAHPVKKKKEGQRKPMYWLHLQSKPLRTFWKKGEQIAKESQDLKEELVAAVEDVRKTSSRKNNIILEGCLIF